MRGHSTVPTGLWWEVIQAGPSHTNLHLNLKRDGSYQLLRCWSSELRNSSACFIAERTERGTGADWRTCPPGKWSLVIEDHPADYVGHPASDCPGTVLPD